MYYSIMMFSNSGGVYVLVELLEYVSGFSREDISYAGFVFGVNK